mmetsp:Transcript_57797/g.102169  ORF Transcript_57797/g.102169 Transcript_57797/m.102169 type:complete len:80 (+) Transcript_57797:784-1023(+)
MEGTEEAVEEDLEAVTAVVAQAAVTVAEVMAVEMEVAMVAGVMEEVEMEAETVAVATGQEVVVLAMAGGTKEVAEQGVL